MDTGVVSVRVVTSPLSLARLLWWYGEDDLWPRALALEPVVVADLATEFARWYGDAKKLERAWPGHPRDAHLLLPVIAHLEGRARPAARTRRRPEKDMPAPLVADEEARWNDPGLDEVTRILRERDAKRR